MNYRDHNNSDAIYSCFNNTPYRSGTKYTQKITPFHDTNHSSPYTLYSNHNEDRSNSYETNFSNSHSNSSSQNTIKYLNGITNICNTCWMDSSLQILLNIPQFMNDLCNTDVSHCSASLIHELARLFIQYSIMPKRKAINPEDFYEILRSRIPSLGDGNQHDVAEFLQLLTENCQEEIFSTLKTPGKNSFSRSKMFAHDPFMKNFGFTTIGKVVCSRCQTVISHTVQSNFIYQLPFVSNSLETCINRAFSPEHFELKQKSNIYDDNSFISLYHDPRYSSRVRVRREKKNDETICPKCRNQTSFELVNSIYRLPRFLFIQIERFDESLQKNSARIDFPYSLDLSNYVDDTYYKSPDPINIVDINQIDIDSLSTKIALRESSSSHHYNYETHCAIEEDEDLKRKTTRSNGNYKLFGVILHQGDYSFGHYMAAFPNGSQDWSIVSDDIVSNNQRLDKSLPYCFIYEKC